MQLTAGQFSGIEGSSDVIFEMDGQIYKFAGQTENAEFAVTVSSGDDGGSGMLGIILIVLAVLVLLGVAAFFFIEFEEVVDEDELTADDSARGRPVCVGQGQADPSRPPAGNRCPGAGCSRSRCSSSLAAPRLALGPSIQSVGARPQLPAAAAMSGFEG